MLSGICEVVRVFYTILYRRKNKFNFFISYIVLFFYPHNPHNLTKKLPQLFNSKI